VGAFSGVENAKMWGSCPEMPKTGSPLAKGELVLSQHIQTTNKITKLYIYIIYNIYIQYYNSITDYSSITHAGII
jgi:hypothetical protein